MKKYILLIALFCFIPFQGKSNTNIDIPQDSVFSFIRDLETGLSELKIGDMTLIGENISFNTRPVSGFLTEEDFTVNMEELSNLGNNMHFEFNNKRNSLKSDDDDTPPTRIEKKSFSNISDVEFFHSYGNIIVKESSSKQVELEIQYFDTKNKKATCSITTTDGLLTISTEKGTDIEKEGSKSSNFSINLGSLNKNGKEKINYIISIPRNTALNIDLKYGNIKMDKHNSPFLANLSYSNMSSMGFGEVKPQIKAKYSDIKIDEAKDLDIATSYTDVRIKKADRVDITGNYNDYNFGDIQTLATGNSSSYGDMKIASVVNFLGNLKYADVVIETLVSDMDVTTAYGDIVVRNVSTGLKSINVKASYADVTISLPQNMSVAFDANISYGDLLVSKKYDVKFTESNEHGNRILKKGQIGSKTPSATIKVSNSYADLRIK